MISNFPSLFIALRYLKPSKNNTMVSIISLFSFLGIVLGVGTLIIVMSVMNGFKTELLDKIIGINGHLNIHFYNKDFNEDKFSNILKSEEDVKVFRKIIDGQGLLTTKNQSTGIIIKGISKKNLIDLKNDKKKEHRQIIVVNAKGQTYVFSGLRMINICDSCMEDNFAIAGNMLASNSVISSMKTAFLINPNVFFPKRLLLTLIAGENAGGDKRGSMSASMEYFKPSMRNMTLRIDYSNNPLKELLMALEQRFSKECKDAFDR